MEAIRYRGRPRGQPGASIRLIDYHEASGEGQPHYAQLPRDRGCSYGEHFGPHDLRVRELGSGRSWIETAASLGITLEAKVQELDALVNLVLRLLAIEKPVSALLERYGATDVEDRAVHALLDDVAQRADHGGMYAPSFGGFINDPDVRNVLAYRPRATRLPVDTHREAYRETITVALSLAWSVQ